MTDYLGHNIFETNKYYFFINGFNKKLYYDRINISEGIDLLKLTAAKIFDLSLLFFLSTELQESACGGCHDLTMWCLNLSDIDVAIFTVKGFIVVFFMRLKNLKQFIC